MDEHSLSHTRWKCQYHIVFIPKYRRKVLYGKVKQMYVRYCEHYAGIGK